MDDSGSVCVALLTGATDMVCTVTCRAVTLHVLFTACGHLSLRKVVRTLCCFMTAPSGGEPCHQFTVGHAEFLEVQIPVAIWSEFGTNWMEILQIFVQAIQT